MGRGRSPLKRADRLRLISAVVYGTSTLSPARQLMFTKWQKNQEKEQKKFQSMRNTVEMPASTAKNQRSRRY